MAMGFGFGCLLKGAGKALGIVSKSLNMDRLAADLMSGIRPLKKTPAKPQIKPQPPFKRNPEHNLVEFDKQLGDQQKAINNMKAKEWLRNREDFNARKKGGVDSNNLDKKEFNKRAKNARDAYRNNARADKYNELRKKGLRHEEATKQTDDYMKKNAALHNPDGVAGGKADAVMGMGDKKVNSSIGSQWDKGRAESIENQVKKQYGIPPKTIDDIPDTEMMNVDLFD
jgi:hypothetical protein